MHVLLVLQAELLRWQQEGSCSINATSGGVTPRNVKQPMKKRVSINTQHGQLEAANQLIYGFVYQDTLPEGSTPEQLVLLLHILLLADRYLVEGCAEAVCEKMVSAPLTVFTPSLVHNLLSVPLGLWEGPLKPLSTKMKVK
jgi:hypothetical protein